MVQWILILYEESVKSTPKSLGNEMKISFKLGFIIGSKNILQFMRTFHRIYFFVIFFDLGVETKAYFFVYAVKKTHFFAPVVI